MANLHEAEIVYQSVANSAYLDIKASAGQQLEIMNLTFGGASELYKSNGTNEVKVDTITEVGGMFNFKLFVNDTNYYRIKNTSGGALYFGYEGVRIL